MLKSSPICAICVQLHFDSSQFLKFKLVVASKKQLIVSSKQPIVSSLTTLHKIDLISLCIISFTDFNLKGIMS